MADEFEDFFSSDDTIPAGSSELNLDPEFARLLNEHMKREEAGEGEIVIGGAHQVRFRCSVPCEWCQILDNADN